MRKNHEKDISAVMEDACGWLMCDGKHNRMLCEQCHEHTLSAGCNSTFIISSSDLVVAHEKQQTRSTEKQQAKIKKKEESNAERGLNMLVTVCMQDTNLDC